MRFIALKMLVGDRAKDIGIIIRLTFVSLLITQQWAIFVGIMTRTHSFLTDVGRRPSGSLIHRFNRSRT